MAPNPGLLGRYQQDGDTTEIEQPLSSVTATIGGSAILPCKVKNVLPPGPVKWFKGTGPNKQIIFCDKDIYPRVQKVNNTNHIFDIRISNITSQDEGIYYCVKFKKNPESEHSSGGGTRLILDWRESQELQVRRHIGATVGSLSLILILSVLCCYFMRRKGSHPCLTRSKDSKKNQPQREEETEAGQEESPLSLGIGRDSLNLESRWQPKGNNEIVYADLQPIGKVHPSMSPTQVKTPHSEYATIHVQ
ncbi:uncharacterized protein LOC122739708 isoform X2 [Dromiciops gliroides]|uniref:uncharacterized protein LOC122739708 isoform X2 n=1 Tax=Dromiciops gliroides TaxID=33562 RepID=UPI001CC7C60D|nr:uncharacterized protein LOC122739708 isoform X2 [Dromiciops gliroides]